MFKRCVSLVCTLVLLSLQPMTAAGAESLLDALNWLFGSNESAATEANSSEVSSLTVSEIPQEAFSDGNDRCFVLSADGRRLLMSGGERPCLWDMETKERTPLYLGDEKSKQAVRDFLVRSKVPGAEKMEDEQLLTGILRDVRPMNGRCAPLLPDAPASMPGIGLRITDQAVGAQWLLDTETGALYCRSDGTVTGCRNGTLLTSPQRPGAAVTLTDMASGEETIIDFADVGGFEQGATVISAAFLPDGSVCAVIRDQRISKEGIQCMLAVHTPDGQMETYPLGKIRFGQEPDVILSADGQRIVIASRIHSGRLHPYQIDRADGRVSLLSWGERGLQYTPLEACLDEKGGVVNEPAGDSLMLLGTCTDGSTLFVYTMSGYLLLLSPGDESARFITGKAGSSEMTIPLYFSSNGCDRFLIITNGKTSLLQLTPQ